METLGTEASRSNPGIRGRAEVLERLASKAQAGGTGESEGPGPVATQQPAGTEPHAVPTPRSEDLAGGPAGEQPSGSAQPEDDSEKWLLPVKGPFGEDIVDLRQVADPEVRERIRADIAKGRTYDHLLTEFDRKVDRAAQERAAQLAEARTAEYLERVGLVERVGDKYEFTDRWRQLQQGQITPAQQPGQPSTTSIPEDVKKQMADLHEKALDGDFEAQLQLNSMIAQYTVIPQVQSVARQVEERSARSVREQQEREASNAMLSRVDSEIAKFGAIKSSRQKQAAKYFVGLAMERGIPFDRALGEVANYAADLQSGVPQNQPRSPAPMPPALSSGATPPPPGPTAAQAAAQPGTPSGEQPIRLGDSRLVDLVAERLRNG